MDRPHAETGDVRGIGQAAVTPVPDEALDQFPHGHAAAMSAEMSAKNGAIAHLFREIGIVIAGHAPESQAHAMHALGALDFVRYLAHAIGIDHRDKRIIF